MVAEFLSVRPDAAPLVVPQARCCTETVSLARGALDGGRTCASHGVTPRAPSDPRSQTNVPEMQEESPLVIGSGRAGKGVAPSTR